LWLNGSRTGPSPRRTVTNATLSGIPAGATGAIATMQNMRQLVRDAVRDPNQRMRELALSIIGQAGYVDQARALQAWVQSNIRYVRDPPDVELLQTPQKTVEYKAGDCDDQSVLLASLLMATGPSGALRRGRLQRAGFLARAHSNIDRPELGRRRNDHTQAFGVDAGRRDLALHSEGVTCS
jgi:hypothetical protein